LNSDPINFSTVKRFYFDRVILHNIRSKSEDEQGSNGYVIDSLESSLWYFWRKKNYSGNDLGIINLEGETDTVAPQGQAHSLLFWYASKDQFEKGCPLPVSIYASKLFTNCRHPSVQIS